MFLLYEHNIEVQHSSGKTFFCPYWEVNGPDVRLNWYVIQKQEELGWRGVVSVE